MKSVLRFLSVIFIFGLTNAKLAGHHHHYDDQHGYAYNGYHHHPSHATLLTAAPALVAKTAPVVVSKGVVPAAAHTYAAAPAAVQAHHGVLPGVAYVNGGVGYHHHPAYYATPIGADHVALLTAAGGKPKTYAQSIPAAAIRNVETVMVTKTITPVVTKTTTHHTRAEPALSLGHVQGYSQGAVGHPKIAPVQFNTAYTTYANPTVGSNGPVAYSGPAVGYAAGLAGLRAVGVAPAPLAKTAAVAAAPAYTVLPGAPLSFASYGIDAHSVPVANYLDFRSGKPVYTAAAVQPLAYGAYGH